MKIIEKESGIETKGAKFHTAGRPENLSDFLNYVNLSIIIGLPASGKSSLIKTLLNGTNENNLYNNVFNSVYYISPSDTMDLNLPENKIISLDTDPLENILQNIIEGEKEQGEIDDPHRVLRSQANQVFFFESTKAEKEIIRDEFSPLDKKEGEQLFNYVFDKTHNFLFINLQLPKLKRMFKNFNQLILKNV